MKIFILGIDGYLGWPLSIYLAARGHKISGVDCFYRRNWIKQMGSQSATPILKMNERLKAFKDNFGINLQFIEGNITDYKFIYNSLKKIMPDAIVHFAEMPSAPYSMIDINHCIFTHNNNLTGTLNLLHAMRDICPNVHLIKLGTMGEYGTPNIDIPEGFFEVNYRNRKDILPFPRQAGSWYHQTKVHDSHNIAMACKIWQLSSTDIMQGVVFGTKINEMNNDERLLTRLDFDQCFGTAINRYCCQAVIGYPITVYGSGRQKRGFLSIRDSMQCITLAIENPPQKGEYRVFNQFERVHDLTELANKVKNIGNKLDLNVKICNIENPRIESENHYYNPDHQRLIDLGYKPNQSIEAEIKTMLQDLIKYKFRIKMHDNVLLPDIIRQIRLPYARCQIRWSGIKNNAENVRDETRLSLWAEKETLI